MALSLDKTISSPVMIKSDGLVAYVTATASDTLYIRVDQVSATKTKAIARISFSGTKINGSTDYTFDIDINGENFIRQAYLFLKTLPEFADAIDC